MKKIKVQVKKKHIKKGRRCLGDRCPVALALEEAAGKPIGVSVEDFYISIYRGKNKANIFRETKSPRSAYRFVKKFDNYKPIEPFNFLFDASWLS
jgi:hypothetical protein